MINKEQIAQQCLNNWFKINDSVTTLDLKNQLRADHPNFFWSQQWVSSFMMTQGLDYVVDINSNGDEYRIYASPNLSVSPDLKDLQDIVASLIVQGLDITKTKLKSCLTTARWSLDNFKDLFNQLGLTHTGKYTSDNHKIWTYVPQGKHLSKTKGQLVDIKTMPKQYLRNAFLKLWNSDPDDFDLILDDPTLEEHQLLLAFFTFDLRQKLNSL